LPSHSYSQYLENPGEAHWEAVEVSLLLTWQGCALSADIQGERHELIGYTDADRSSQTQQVSHIQAHILIAWGAIHGGLKARTCGVVHSEQSIIAATHATKEGIWLCQLSEAIQHHNEQPLVLRQSGGLMLATNNNFHTHTSISTFNTIHPRNSRFWNI